MYGEEPIQVGSFVCKLICSFPASHQRLDKVGRDLQRETEPASHGCAGQDMDCSCPCATSAALSTWSHQTLEGSDGEPSKQDTNLTGLGVHVPTAEEFFYNLHVLLCLHGGECRQHDRRVPRLVLVIYVTHVCRTERSLGRTS